jgi:alpha-mannosidase
MPCDGERPGADVLRAAEAYRHDLLAAAGYGPVAAPPPPSRTGVEITGDGVVMTSLRTRDGWIETRMVAESAEPATAVLRGPFTEAARVDLRGRPVLPLDVHAGTVTLALRPWEIATVRLRRA